MSTEQRLGHNGCWHSLIMTVIATPVNGISFTEETLFAHVEGRILFDALRVDSSLGAVELGIQ